MTTANTHIIALQAQAIVELLGSDATPDAYEGNAEALLQAMGANGHCNPNHAYLFELNPGDGRLQVINDTEGFTLLVDPATGEATPAPEDETAMPAGPAPAPVAYYRVLVNQDGEKLFRTSRLHSVGTMLVVLESVRRGFLSDPAPTSDFGFQVLAVDANGAGRILPQPELDALRVG